MRGSERMRFKLRDVSEGDVCYQHKGELGTQRVTDGFAIMARDDSEPIVKFNSRPKSSIIIFNVYYLFNIKSGVNAFIPSRSYFGNKVPFV